MLNAVCVICFYIIVLRVSSILQQICLDHLFIRSVLGQQNSLNIRQGSTPSTDSELQMLRVDTGFFVLSSGVLISAFSSSFIRLEVKILIAPFYLQSFIFLFYIFCILVLFFVRYFLSCLSRLLFKKRTNFCVCKPTFFRGFGTVFCCIRKLKHNGCFLVISSGVQLFQDGYIISRRNDRFGSCNWCKSTNFRFWWVFGYNLKVRLEIL